MRSCYASQWRSLRPRDLPFIFFDLTKALSGMLWDSFTPWGMTVPSG
jgi:hypothetical protein